MFEKLWSEIPFNVRKGGEKWPHYLLGVKKFAEEWFEKGRKAGREEMRCETCARFGQESEYNGICYDKIANKNLGKRVQTNFGCVHHEKKEAT